ncbi:hypothetical protein C1H46_005102 [Malus baccata]|uniref:Uncharacterized protein n=1 Tax=Malus baccata TaxID=106549 RepID=A0A540NDP7_MALBA|nr:hypothetical protein C1H46_005102 [Malus baccata]
MSSQKHVTCFYRVLDNFDVEDEQHNATWRDRQINHKIGQHNSSMTIIKRAFGNQNPQSMALRYSQMHGGAASTGFALVLATRSLCKPVLRLT